MSLKEDAGISSNGGVVLTLLFVFFLIVHTVANADQITSFVADGSQCAYEVRTNDSGKVGLAIRDGSGSLIFTLLNADGTIPTYKRDHGQWSSHALVTGCDK